MYDYFKEHFVVIFYCLMIVLVGSLIYVSVGLKKEVVNLKTRIDTTNSKYVALEGEFSKSKHQVSILEVSVGSKDKRWAKIKQVRTIIQEDIRKNHGYGNNLNVNDIASVAGSIVDYSDEFDVPLALVAAVMRTESAYDPVTPSMTGAQGLMQIMKPTADELAAELGIKYYNIRKITDNTRLGAYYLWKLLKRFNGEIELAIRSYNCGPVYTEKVMSGEYPDYPKETNDYVIRVLSNMTIFESAGL
jgi:soluble lytic murein transglycosylase-like protein